MFYPENFSGFDWQPLLENECVKVVPLTQGDFELLYAVACDPLIWEQHPNPDRYKAEVFRNFFDGALKSGGAFKVMNAKTLNVIGSSRFYGFNPEKSEVSIGYTFLARDHWGTTHNRALKTLMLDHAFRFAQNVLFHIGACNIRSQKAIERLGAIKIAEEEMAYYGEKAALNFIYRMEKSAWNKAKEKTHL